MHTEYHFEADDMDAQADIWQEQQDAQAEANAEAESESTTSNAQLLECIQILVNELKAYADDDAVAEGYGRGTRGDPHGSIQNALLCAHMIGVNPTI